MGGEAAEGGRVPATPTGVEEVEGGEGTEEEEEGRVAPGGRGMRVWR